MDTSLPRLCIHSLMFVVQFVPTSSHSWGRSGMLSIKEAHGKSKNCILINGLNFLPMMNAHFCSIV